MRTWQVGDVMTTQVVAVGAEAGYREIVDEMLARRVSAVPVLDEFRRVLGVVSEADLLHRIENAGDPAGRRIFEGRRHRSRRLKAGALLARDLMTTPPVTTYAETSLPAAARLMESAHVKRLPVLDDLGRLVGIVTRSDLLKVHLRSDAEIRSDVVDEVLRRILAVQDGLVTVAVRHGSVTLEGRLERRTDADLAARLAAKISGVVQVENRIGYDVDDTVLIGLTPGTKPPVA